MKPSLEQVLTLVDQLSPEELIELRRQLNAKSLTWSNADLQIPTERAALFAQEEAKAAERIRQAFEYLLHQGIVDKNGHLIEKNRRTDMETESSGEVGG